MSVRYVVVNENTLGYIHYDVPTQVGILHASVLRGAITFHGSIHIVAGHTVVRPATLKDFEEYRVVPPKGWAG